MDRGRLQYHLDQLQEARLAHLTGANSLLEHVWRASLSDYLRKIWISPAEYETDSFVSGMKAPISLQFYNAKVLS
jgi:hypothetical protein